MKVVKTKKNKPKFIKKTPGDVIREKFDPRLQEGEQILWSSTIKSIIPHDRSGTSFIVIFMIFLLGVGICVNSPSIGAVYVVFISIIIYNHFSNQEENFSSLFTKEGQVKTVYDYSVITNLGCLHENETFTRIPFSKFYHVEIKKIKNKDQVILLASPLKNTRSEKDLIIKGNYDANKLRTLIYPHWENTNPNRPIQETSRQLSTTYGLKKTITTTGVSSFQGTYKNFEIAASWKDTVPVKSISIQVKCNNPTNSYFDFRREGLGSNLKKLTLQKEHETGQPEFDNTFFLEVDNKNLARQFFNRSTLQNKMLNIIEDSDCSWTFGKPSVKKQKIKISKSKLNDQEDILDFQLLKEDHSNFISTKDVNWQEGLTSILTFQAIILEKQSLNPDSMGKLILNSFESVIEMAEGIDNYHEKNNGA